MTDRHKTKEIDRHVKNEPISKFIKKQKSPKAKVNYFYLFIYSTFESSPFLPKVNYFH